MLRKTLMYGTLLAMLSNPLAAQDINKTDTDVRKEIHSLEMKIAEKAKESYRKLDSELFIIYENPSVCLDRDTEASVVIVFDKEKSTYRFFNMNIHSTHWQRKNIGLSQTIERHFDEGLNGYETNRPMQTSDSYSEYDRKNGNLSRSNMLYTATPEKTLLLNRQFRDRLVQLHQGCSRR